MTEEIKSTSRGPPLFRGDTQTRGPWATWEFRFQAYLKGRKCSGPMTRDCPVALPINAAAAVRDRRQEEIQKWEDQNDEAYGYLVQAMEENDGAVA